MALNLLSDAKDVADTSATKKSAVPSSVAFRLPIEEQSLPVVAKKKAPPIVKKQTPLHPDLLNVKASASRERSSNRDVTGYTKPEALSEAFGVNILGAIAEQDRMPPSPALLLIAVTGAFLGTALVLSVWFMLMTEEEGRMSARAQAEKATLAALSASMEESEGERKSAEERLGTIETAQALLSRHIYWTRFFRFLEAVTLPDVYYTNLAVDPAGNIRLAAIGRNFSAVARQLLAFEESGDVETIRTTKAAAEISGSLPGVQFDLALAVKPELLFNRPLAQ